jgi:hypothetical protein
VDLTQEGEGLKCRRHHWDKLNEFNDTIGMKHFGLEYHFGRKIRKLFWEGKCGFKKSPFVKTILRSLEAYSPDE